MIYAAAGNNHVYVHADADLEMARRVAYNAKVQRPGVCNAAETLLVDAAVADELLPEVLADLHAAGVELMGDEGSRAAAGDAAVGEATAEDWDTEYLDMRMTVGVVDSLAEAIAHVNLHGTGHSEAIVTSSRCGPGVHGRSRCGGRLRERVDAVHRRVRVRDGGRDRELDPEASRARADRPSRADNVQVRRPGRRADQGYDGSPRSAFSGARSTRRTSGTSCSRRRLRSSSGSTRSCSCRWANRRTSASIRSRAGGEAGDGAAGGERRIRRSKPRMWRRREKDRRSAFVPWS